MVRVATMGLAFAAIMIARVARSQEKPAEAPPPAQAPAPAGAPGAPGAPGPMPIDATAEAKLDVIEGTNPPPTNIFYFQYGVALAAEIPSSAGAMCDTTEAPCILGPGGGVALRAGWRGAGPIYLGGAYELTKQDPSKLYRLALLQQARAEGRYYFSNARITAPYAAVGLGVAGYGNEWGVDTWGPAGSLGFGLEYQVTQRTVIGTALNYRLIYFSQFTDTSGAARDGGIAQLIGFDFVLEQRDPSFTPEQRAAAKGTPTGPTTGAPTPGK
jgi:hypothetical protein